MTSTFICPKCSAKVTKDSMDAPGCPACGLGKHEHVNGPAANRTQCCTVCNEQTCVKHVLLG